MVQLWYDVRWCSYGMMSDGAVYGMMSDGAVYGMISDGAVVV